MNGDSPKDAPGKQSGCKSLEQKLLLWGGGTLCTELRPKLCPKPLSNLSFHRLGSEPDLANLGECPAHHRRLMTKSHQPVAPKPLWRRLVRAPHSWPRPEMRCSHDTPRQAEWVSFQPGQIGPGKASGRSPFWAHRPTRPTDRPGSHARGQTSAANRYGAPRS